MCSNDHNFIAKVVSGASRNCISKSLWNRIKVGSKLAKSDVVLTGAGGSKLSLLGFAEITCPIGISHSQKNLQLLTEWYPICF